MGATCCKSGTGLGEVEVINDSLEVQKLHYQENMSARGIDEALLQELLQVEKDKEKQDRLAKDKQVRGCSMIVTLDITAAGADKIELLMVQEQIKSLLEALVWPESTKDSITLVKADGPRFFVYAINASQALQAAFKVQHVVAALLKGPKVETRIGIADGSVILLPGDMYGDPVNTSSKLGEDLAKAGEIFVSAIAFQAACEDTAVKKLLPSITTAVDEVEISNVKLTYTSVRANDLSQLVQAIGIQHHEPGQMVGEASSFADASSKKIALMVTDMSGFTSLTKKYGILHFLRLVLQARSIFVPRIESNGGHVVKYEGDNIIAVFPTATDALTCIKSAKIELRNFNSSREKDFQIRMGAAVAEGEVMVIGHDILGDSFDHCFHLAEEISEAGEVLVAASLWDSLRDMGLHEAASAVQTAEHPTSKASIQYHAVDFR